MQTSYDIHRVRLVDASQNIAPTSRSRFASDTFSTSKCPVCGGDGGETLTAGGMTITACCDSCEAQKQTEWRAEEDRRAKMERLIIWEAICDPLFRAYDPSHPEMDAAFATAYQDFDPVYRQGLCLIGAPGTGKTHAALWCLRKCLDAGLRIAKVKHSEFAKIAATLARGYGHTTEENKSHHAAEEKIKHLYTADAILLDDVCKGRKTPTSDEGLYNLLNHRVEKGKITIWTANHGSKRMLAHFGAEYGMPIVRRMAANTVVVVAEKT